MNHIYRVIWNEVAHSFVAVSEIAKARGKPASTVGSTVGWAGSICPRGAASASFDLRVGTKACPPYAPLALTLALALTGTPAHALDIGALPTGGNVTAGAAAISQTANALTVQQTSQRAAIDWQSFNIGSAATVNFNQPNANAVALNRIIGNSTTEIYGKLNANGQVFFSNPNGMLFAKGAQVNVGGILATTLNLNNEDFMAGNYRFTNPGAGAIRNEGLINALGSAALIGDSVENAGQIVATTVTLAAGNSVAVDLSGDGLIRARVEDAALHASIENSGSIEGAQITLTAGQAKDALDRVVNNTGIIRATGLSMQGGEILLEGGQTLNSGTLDASASLPSPLAGEGPGERGNSTNGGTIQVLGQQVGILDGATVTANGTQNGGTILIGGDYQGKLSLLLGDGGGEGSNAQATYIAPTATLSADGGILTPSPLAGEGWGEGVGNGGKIIVWADDTTRAYGSISAQGGANGGNGGFIETSGHYLDVAGIKINATAPDGQAGTWLLDPWDVTIAATADTGGTFTTNTWTPDATGSTITAATILSALDAGTAVTITTGTPEVGTEVGNITVSAPIAMTGTTPTSLALQAAGTIVVNQSITSTNAALDLTLDHGAAGNASIATGVTVNLSDGVLDTQNAGVTSTGTLNLTGTLVNAALKTATLNSTSGTLNNVTIGSSMTESGAVLYIENNLLLGEGFNFNVGAGIVRFRGAAANIGLAAGAAQATLTYNGTLYANASNNGGVVTIASGVTVQGYSGLGNVYANGGWVNNGVILNNTAGTLTINPTNFTNNGTVSAVSGTTNITATNLTLNAGNTLGVSGGTLTINPTNTWSNAGAFNVSAGTLNLGGALTMAGLAACRT